MNIRNLFVCPLCLLSLTLLSVFHAILVPTFALAVSGSDSSGSDDVQEVESKKAIAEAVATQPLIQQEDLQNVGNLSGEFDGFVKEKFRIKKTTLKYSDRILTQEHEIDEIRNLNALHIAVLGKDIGLCKTVLNKNRNLLLQKDSSGFTPFHHSIARGYLDIFKYFLDEKVSLINRTVEISWEASADSESFKIYRRCPIIVLAVIYDYSEIVDYFLTKSSGEYSEKKLLNRVIFNVISATSPKANLLSLALKCGSSNSAISILKKMGTLSDESQKAFLMESIDGYPILHEVVRVGLVRPSSGESAFSIFKSVLELDEKQGFCSLGFKSTDKYRQGNKRDTGTVFSIILKRSSVDSSKEEAMKFLTYLGDLLTKSSQKTVVKKILELTNSENETPETLVGKLNLNNDQLSVLVRIKDSLPKEPSAPQRQAVAVLEVQESGQQASLNVGVAEQLWKAMQDRRDAASAALRESTESSDFKEINSASLDFAIWTLTFANAIDGMRFKPTAEEYLNLLVQSKVRFDNEHQYSQWAQRCLTENPDILSSKERVEVTGSDLKTTQEIFMTLWERAIFYENVSLIELIFKIVALDDKQIEKFILGGENQAEDLGERSGLKLPERKNYFLFAAKHESLDVLKLFLSKLLGNREKVNQVLSVCDPVSGNTLLHFVCEAGASKGCLNSILSVLPKKAASELLFKKNKADVCPSCLVVQSEVDLKSIFSTTPDVWRWIEQKLINAQRSSAGEGELANGVGSRDGNQEKWQEQCRVRRLERQLPIKRAQEKGLSKKEEAEKQVLRRGTKRKLQMLSELVSSAS
jgi:hypothetical protein